MIRHQLRLIRPYSKCATFIYSATLLDTLNIVMTRDTVLIIFHLVTMEHLHHTVIHLLAAPLPAAIYANARLT